MKNNNNNNNLRGCLEWKTKNKWWLNLDEMSLANQSKYIHLF